MTSTPAQLRAAAAFRARRQEAGYVRVDVQLAPDVVEILDRAVAVYGSQASAISAGLALLPLGPNKSPRTGVQASRLPKQPPTPKNPPAALKSGLEELSVRVAPHGRDQG